MKKVLLVASLVFSLACSKKNPVADTVNKAVSATEKMASRTAEAVSNGLNVTGSNVDVESSTLNWKGTKKIGDEHYGKLKLKSANIKLEGSKVLGGVFIVDMNSMTVDDLAPEKGGNKLLGHLKNDDFFGTDKHPTAKFVLTSLDDNKGYGDLTIKGITVKNLEFDHSYNATAKKFSGKLAFNRTDYGIRYGSGKFFDNLGDKVIDDMVQVDLNIVLK